MQAKTCTAMQNSMKTGVVHEHAYRPPENIRARSPSSRNMLSQNVVRHHHFQDPEDAEHAVKKANTRGRRQARREEGKHAGRHTRGEWRKHAGKKANTRGRRQTRWEKGKHAERGQTRGIGSKHTGQNWRRGETNAREESQTRGTMPLKCYASPSPRQYLT